MKSFSYTRKLIVDELMTSKLITDELTSSNREVANLSRSAFEKLVTEMEKEMQRIMNGVYGKFGKRPMTKFDEDLRPAFRSEMMREFFMSPRRSGKSSYLDYAFSVDWSFGRKVEFELDLAPIGSETRDG